MGVNGSYWELTDVSISGREFDRRWYRPFTPAKLTPILLQRSLLPFKNLPAKYVKIFENCN